VVEEDETGGVLLSRTTPSSGFISRYVNCSLHIPVRILIDERRRNIGITVVLATLQCDDSLLPRDVTAADRSQSR